VHNAAELHVIGEKAAEWPDFIGVQGCENHPVELVWDYPGAEADRNEVENQHEEYVKKDVFEGEDFQETFLRRAGLYYLRFLNYNRL